MKSILTCVHEMGQIKKQNNKNTRSICIKHSYRHHINYLNKNPVAANKLNYVLLLMNYIYCDYLNINIHIDKNIKIHIKTHDG